jgi:hypothetical protein
MIDINPIFLASDQPTTCPKCGARSDFEDYTISDPKNILQIHTCLNLACKFEFLVDCHDEFNEIIADEE